MSTMTKTVDHAGEQVKHSAAHARSGFVDLAAQALRLVNNIREAEERGVTSFLSRLGLQRRQSVARPVLWFAAGAVAAGAAALLLAPMKGDDLIKRITNIVRGAAHDVETAVKHVASSSVVNPRGVLTLTSRAWG
jgi:hypothetical protein